MAGAPAPWAWATGSLVTAPSWVFSPRARAGSDRSASCQPWLARLTAYGRVTLVSAYVEVFGTAPGMLATQ